MERNCVHLFSAETVLAVFRLQAAVLGNILHPVKSSEGGGVSFTETFSILLPDPIHSLAVLARGDSLADWRPRPLSRLLPRPPHQGAVHPAWVGDSQVVHPNLKQFIVVTSFGASLFFVTRLTTVTTFYLSAEQTGNGSSYFRHFAQRKR